MKFSPFLLPLQSHHESTFHIDTALESELSNAGGALKQRIQSLEELVVSVIQDS